MKTLFVQIEIIAQRWFEFMIASSVQLGIFITLIILLTLLFRKQSAKFLYWIWFIGLLKIFIPPSIKLPTFISQSKIVLNTAIPIYVLPEIQFATLSAARLSYQGFLFLIWLVVLFILVVFWIFKLKQLNTAVTQSSYDITAKILERYNFETGNRI